MQGRSAVNSDEFDEAIPTQALSDCRTELAKQTADTAATEKQIEELAVQLARCQAVCKVTEQECAAEQKEIRSLQQRAYDA